MNRKKACGFCMALCIIFSFAGCVDKKPKPMQENPKTEATEPDVSFVQVMTGDMYLENWHENNVVTQATWQKLRLTAECQESYPTLWDAFDRYNEESESQAKAWMQDTESIIADIEADEYNPTYCQTETKAYMQRADNHMVSFLESVHQYTGGVHPDYFVHGRNYITTTGAEAALSDVLTDTAELRSILEKKLSEKYTDVPFFDLKTLLEQYEDEDFSWTMDYQGITFWFSPYELAAYVFGTLSAKIWFDEYPELFKEVYTKAPKQYVLPLPIGFETEFDLKGDGQKDTIYAEKRLDDYGSYYMLSLTVNGNTGVDEMNYAYDYDLYLVHKENKNYLYSDSVSDNDYHMFCTWDLNGKAPVLVHEMYGTGVFSEYIEEGYETGTVYTQGICDPESFCLAKRLEVLGTRDGIAQYRVGEDGAPDRVDADLNIESEWALTSKIPLEGKILPDEKAMEFSAGTVFYPLRTDGESYVDLKTEDGTRVRFSYDTSDYPWKVNGIPEEECFDSIMYAG